MGREEFTMFKLSKPWGYYPPEVEDKIRQYERALKDINEKYQEERRTVNALTKRMESLQEELRDMHMQMSSLELPPVEEAIEHYVLEDFSQYNSPEPKKKDVSEPIDGGGFTIIK